MQSNNQVNHQKLEQFLLGQKGVCFLFYNVDSALPFQPPSKGNKIYDNYIKNDTHIKI